MRCNNNPGAGFALQQPTTEVRRPCPVLSITWETVPPKRRDRRQALEWYAHYFARYGLRHREKRPQGTYSKIHATEEGGGEELFAPKIKTRSRAPALQSWPQGGAWSHGLTNA